MQFSKIYTIKDKGVNIAFMLKLAEFACSCNYASCNHALVDLKLVENWNICRARYGKPLRVNSGFRCQKHNEDVGGVHDSKHTLGKAIDISTRGMSEVEKYKLIEIFRAHFDFIKEYPTFFHAHVN